MALASQTLAEYLTEDGSNLPSILSACSGMMVLTNTATSLPPLDGDYIDLTLVQFLSYLLKKVGALPLSEYTELFIIKEI